MSLRRAALLAIIAAAPLLPISSADAQLGGMIRRRVRDAVVGKSDSTPAAPTGRPSSSGGSSSGSSTVVPITNDVISQFVTAMAPRLEYGERYAAWRRGADARKAWFECADKQTDGATPRLPQTPAEEARYTRVMGEMTRVTQKLAQGGDRNFTRMMQDSMDVVKVDVTLLMFPFVATRCGRAPAGGSPMPETPAPLAMPTGMTAAQFGLLRERIALALAYPSQSTGLMALSAEEQAAVTARARDLSKFAAAVRDKTVRFTDWEDLTRGVEEPDRDR